MRDRDEREERESPSGAMRGTGEGPGSPSLPFPRTDSEDTGLGDGGLEREAARRTRPPARTEEDARDDPLGDGRDDDARGRSRTEGGWGDEGIAGGRAGGTGL